MRNQIPTARPASLIGYGSGDTNFNTLGPTPPAAARTGTRISAPAAGSTRLRTPVELGPLLAPVVAEQYRERQRTAGVHGTDGQRGRDRRPQGHERDRLEEHPGHADRVPGEAETSARRWGCHSSGPSN
jgi:hypothetical protein